MFVSPETMAVLLECVPPDRIMDVVNAFGRDAEAMTPKLSTKPDAVRQRRHRAKGAGVTETVTCHTECHGQGNAGSFLSPSLPPEPPNPSTNLSPVPPIVPQTGKKSAPKTPSLAEQIFLLQPVCEGRRKSPRPDVVKALGAALGRGGDPAEILAACQAFYRLPASTKDGGRFANGAAVILNADRWRDFLPSPEPPAIITPAEQQWRLDHYRATREWKPSWGERPKDAA